MSRLSDLPPELLDRVCELIPRQATLANLSQCSHQLYAVAAPRLYRSIDLCRTRWKDGLRHLEVITALLLRKPELACSVRHLAIRESSTRSVEKNEEPLLPEIQEAVKHLAEQVGNFTNLSSARSDNPVEPEDDDRAEVEVVEFEDGDWSQDDADSDAGHSSWSTTDGSESEDDPDDEIPTDAESALRLAQSSEYFRDAILLAILFPCLSKLTSLDLELMEPARLRFVQALFRFPIGTERLLRHVKTVCIGNSRPEVRLDLWRDLFTLPNLSSVYMHRVLALRGQTLWGCAPSAAAVNPVAELRPRSLDITHIEMRDCRISPWELRRILEVPKALKTFIYDIGEGTNQVEPAINISYKSVREALEQQKDSLEEIWIDYPHDYLFDEWGGAGTTTRPMGSLAQFKQLKKLRIASTYLFGFTEDTDVDRLVNSLPDQVEMLHLTHGDEDEEITAGLRKLLEARQLGRFQGLKELKVDVSTMWLAAKGHPPLADRNRHNKDVMAELVHKADGLGLEMKLFANYSESRTHSPPHRVHSATRSHWTGPERTESKWGFDGEVDWPPRMNGCMQRPQYPEIKIDEQGDIRTVDGFAPVEVPTPEMIFGPTLLGPIFFDG